LFKKIFGSRNQRLIKKFNRTVVKINALEPAIEALDDAALVAKTEEYRSRYRDGETLDALLPEAFATVREAARRTLGMRHFDTQLVGGMVLHEGKIAEMRTGEGKTLVATLAAYLNAIPGDGVHVITVNDYLAKRDAEWMGKVYRFLGLTVGVIRSGQPPEDKKAAYACDVVYGTNNEYGFDYLRDNMAFQSDDRMQGKLSFAIVDEVDSILIDEARTPLIISGPAEGSSDLYRSINSVIPSLVEQVNEDGPGDFSVDEKSKQAFLTEAGHEHAEQLLEKAGLLPAGSSLYDVTNISLLHHLNAALRAHKLFKSDVDYIVSNNEIVIIDEFTGRMMQGRRWSDGLHQAVEAKEGVKIQEENQTLASITFQNYFRLYEKLSGMTGTADTEAFEFQQIYALEVVVIPSNMPARRDDLGDQIFRTVEEKYHAILADVEDCQKRQQPVLVGTASIDSSEYISNLLTKAKVKHEVLNAKQHEREALIIAQAGAPGSVTIATNMAGRGTDIVLGGNLEMELAEAEADEARAKAIKEAWQVRHDAVIQSGGLHVIGTERHESRRIDNQLRGRSGRQGDPGSTRFYLSLQDSLMRIFASEKVSAIMQKLGMEDGEAIEHPWVSKAIENAQRKVEGRNFDIRKQLLEYDDVANEQRKVIYKQRNDLMDTDDISENISQIRHEVVDNEISAFVVPGSMPEQWDLEHLEEVLANEFSQQLPLRQWMEEDHDLHEETLREQIQAAIDESYQGKVDLYGREVMNHLEKAITLQVLDSYWKDHLASMDHLRQGIGLRGYAQKDPKQEYKREAFETFTTMLDRIKREITTLLARVQLREENELAEMESSMQQQQQQAMEFNHPDVDADSAESVAADQTEKTNTPYVRQEKKVGRNEPCPCGSGKKYKQCHGKIA